MQDVTDEITTMRAKHGFEPAIATLTRSFALDAERVARLAGWVVAENDVDGVYVRAPNDRELAERREDPVYAHSWQDACEIDGLGDLSVAPSSYLEVDEVEVLLLGRTGDVIIDYASAARAAGWRVVRCGGEDRWRLREDRWADDALEACEWSDISPLVVSTQARIGTLDDGRTIWASARTANDAMHFLAVRSVRSGSVPSI